MSIRIMSQVWDNPPYKDATLVVLLALADFADDEGRCFPSVPVLARKANTSKRLVRRALARFEEDGWLTVEGPDAYRICAAPAPPQEWGSRCHGCRRPLGKRYAKKDKRCRDCQRAFDEWRAQRSIKDSRKRKRFLQARVLDQDGICPLCFDPLPSDLALLDLDHIVPVARGGGSELGNLQATHRFCNRSKGAGRG